MDDLKYIYKIINNFTKLVLDMEILKVKVEDEDQAVFLINPLPNLYEHL